MNTFIQNKKCTKSDIHKTRKEILIGYTGMSNHLWVWAPRIYHVLIASKLVVNKGKRVANQFIKHLLPPLEKSL